MLVDLLFSVFRYVFMKIVLRYTNFIININGKSLFSMVNAILPQLTGGNNSPYGTDADGE